MKVIIFILLIFIGLFLKKAKWYDFAIILFIVFITFNGQNVADFENYQKAYNYIGGGAFYSDLGIGWYYLCRLGTQIGLSYIQFKTIIIVMSYILINGSIKYFLKEKNNQKKVIWAFYLIFPLLLDCIQVRFLIAEAIVIYSLKFLINDKKRGILYYIIGVFIASTIHSSALFYLIFLLYKIIGNYENKYITIVMIFIITFVFAKDYVIKLSSLFVNEERINRYFYSKDAIGIKGFIIYSVIIVAFYYISKLMLRTAKNAKLDSDNVIFYEFNLKINIIMTILIAFSIFDPNFFRLQRLSWILFYIGIVKLLNNNIKNIEGLKISLKLLGLIISIMGNLTLISITTPEIIKSFLI